METWTAEDYWVYRTYHKNDPLNDFKQFQDFKELWDRKRKGDDLPAWKDFELEDFTPWTGWIGVEDVLSTTPYDSKFRLWGTNITTLYGVDLTNQQMSQVGRGIFSEDDFAIGALICKEQLIAINSGPMNWRGLGHRCYTFMQIPLSDDGTTVDKILQLITETEGEEVLT